MTPKSTKVKNVLICMQTIRNYPGHRHPPDLHIREASPSQIHPTRRSGASRIARPWPPSFATPHCFFCCFYLSLS